MAGSIAELMKHVIIYISLERTFSSKSALSEMDAPRATAPAAPINAPGMPPNQNDTTKFPDPASHATNTNATYTTQPSLASHKGSAVQVARRYDKATPVPFNKTVIQHFENGLPGSDVLFELHNQLISWLKHHGFRSKGPVRAK
ncbi:hypothetical protein AC578_6534 [Pseudocercospora eumusae]|uniref:Uncharacterized protein n=1 Tax=Pseudocercospora eumusae TaxID=321146 RepID=A0A139HHV1_9PEZI|nr:hypothetical protein AC578_6534 [Pseudocercospora eumusae]